MKYPLPHKHGYLGTRDTTTSEKKFIKEWTEIFKSVAHDNGLKYVGWERHDTSPPKLELDKVVFSSVSHVTEINIHLLLVETMYVALEEMKDDLYERGKMFGGNNEDWD